MRAARLEALRLRQRFGLLLAPLGALACGGAAREGRPDCETLALAADREECRYTLTLPLVDDEPALNRALAAIADDASHDLLLLRLAITRPDQGARLCARTRTAQAQEKCQQVVGRPHLQTTRRPPQPPG